MKLLDASSQERSLLGAAPQLSDGVNQVLFGFLFSLNSEYFRMVNSDNANNRGAGWQ